MSRWTINGTQILKDGEPIFLKGVCYSPTPAGAATFTPGVGDWFTPPWNAIWERDFPLMQRMGLNNLRTYFFWAWTPPNDMTTWQQVTSGPPTFDHAAFLDAAAGSGIYVTIGIALDAGNVFDNANPQLGQDYLDFYTATATKLAQLYGNHPAVMGFCLGNETNNPTRIRTSAYWDKFATLAQAVRQNATDKLVMVAMQNDPGLLTATIDGTSTTVVQRYAQIFDVWGLNIYSGMATTLDSYATQVAGNSNSQRPLIVSEWGVPGGKNVPDGAAGPPDGNATSRELTQEEFTTEINQTMNPNGQAMKSHLDFVAGAQFFEWSDEWWKNGATPIYTQDASGSPDYPEEWWGLHSITPVGRTAQQGPWDNSANQPFPPDQLTARPTVGALTSLYQNITGG